MQVSALIYARFNSSRLPGKVLYDIGAGTVLGVCINKLKTVSALNLIIATSNERSDDPIAKWAKDNDVACFRGDLNNVAKRTIQCIDKYPSEAFFRVNADSPFLQPFLFEEALSIFNRNGHVDIVSNVYERSFPYGIAVELINTQTFVRHARYFTSSEQEHITTYFYSNSSTFNILNIKSKEDHSQMRWVLDTPEDWDRLKKLNTIYPDLYKLHLEQLIRIQENFEIQ